MHHGLRARPACRPHRSPRARQQSHHPGRQRQQHVAERWNCWSRFCAKRRSRD